MNMKNLFAAFSVSLLATSASAGSWSFSAGPAWRSHVKMDVRETGAGGGVTSRSWNNLGKSPDQYTLGTDIVQKENPRYPDYSSDEYRWALKSERTDITAGSGFGASDTESGMGLDLRAGYDFFEKGAFSLGLSLRFAGFWGMKSSHAGMKSGGTTATFWDYFLYSEAPCSGNWNDDVVDWGTQHDATPYAQYSETKDAPTAGAATPYSTRLRGDLYQIGLGPKATWHACEWLDVYAGADVLLNLARSELSTDAGSASDTACMIGFGGNVGLVGKITKNLGVYGQIGYEWIDDSDVSAGGYRAEIDYSSLVLSAGVQVSF